MEHQSLREEVARIARTVSVSGLVTGTSGNVSARTPEGYVLVTPSGLDYALLEPEDVVLVDPEGRVLEGSLEPSSEMPMHAGIYRSKPRVGGIVHTHARFSTTLACLGWEIPPVHYMLVVLSGEGRVPLAPYATYGTEELARHAADTLGDSHHACLLRNHGTIAVGETASEALSRTEILEELAEIYYRARLAGEPILLTSEQVNEASAKMSTYGQPRP
jgi:L-fuculose-phosphate aldolase